MTNKQRDQHPAYDAAPRTDWLPGGHDGDIGERETATDPGADVDADFPVSDGWSPDNPSRMLTFNGIDALTGDYWSPPMPESDVAKVLGSKVPDPEEAAYLRKFYKERKNQRRERILRPGVDPKNLAETGWGVIFPKKCDPKIREKLSTLLNLRKQQIGRSALYKEYIDDKAYEPGQSAQSFLYAHGGGSGPVDPENVPYYLLLVGGPDEIPFHLQSQLGVRHAVGRVHFDDLEDYSCYAESVKMAEDGWQDSRQEVVLFSAANDGDNSTQRSHVELVQPVARLLDERSDWRVRVVAGKEAGREQLLQLLGGKETPPVLFTATHGLVYPPDWRMAQKRFQGALLCGNWPGPVHNVEREHMLTGEDILDSACLRGTICFHFACFSAGTPQFDNFAYSTEKRLLDMDRESSVLGRGAQVASAPFISPLPKRLLSLPAACGALAVVGHVDRAWTCSFSYLGSASDAIVIESILEELLYAYPLGHAMRYMSRRYADLASDVTVVEDPSAPAADLDTSTRARLWRAQSDARNFIVLGDPAVHLPSAKDVNVPRRRDGRLTVPY